MLERLQKDGYARYEDLPLQTRDNHQIAVEFVGNVYPAGDRKVIQCIIRDISERKRLSLELERSQRQQLLLKDEILSQVSHELRLPLAATYQFITILLDGLVGTLDDGQRQYLKLALKNINQLRTMIDDLLEVARAVSGKLTIEPRCVALGELVVETLATLQGAASAKGIALKLNVPDELPLAWVDRRRVQQILWALLDNAIKFTPDNGSIAVRIEANENDADFLTFGIADTGCGIPRDDRERVFDRLFQVDNILEVSRKGLGLGLYICKDLVTRHGGRIWIESPQRTLPAQTACGSEIFFTLPRLPWTKLLAPVVGQNGPHSGRFNVITAKVLRQDNEPCVQELGEAARTLAWKTLSRCLHSDREVLLPRFATQENEQFLVIAGADQSGAEDLITRIHEQVQSDKGLHHAGLDLSSSFIVLDTPILENTGVLVHELGRRFESLMKEKTTEKS
jgi:signal transduction histidine kinase